MSLDHSRHGAFISECEGLVTQGRCLVYQFLGVGGSPQKCIVADAVQFSVLDLDALASRALFAFLSLPSSVRRCRTLAGGFDGLFGGG